MVKILLITLGIVAFAVILLSLKLLIKGDARGPMTHIGASKAMRERGIHCVESMDAIERAQLRKEKVKEKRI
jgi:hypothetical protein